jgi:hypothetical protein
LKLDPLVAQIIVATNFDHFSTSDVRSAYLALKSDASLDPVYIRRKIYADLLKLVKKGWLKKMVSKKKGLTSFSKTDTFSLENLMVIFEDNTKGIKAEVQGKKEQLRAKLNHYKAELLLNIGESEAYKELYSEHPELIAEIQTQYNDARDNNTRILGKIRAIEGLLKQINN